MRFAESHEKAHIILATKNRFNGRLRKQKAPPWGVLRFLARVDKKDATLFFPF